MFEISEDKKVASVLPLIHSGYKSLWHDEEDVLFTGYNVYGDRVIGSILCEDIDLPLIRHLHIVVAPILYQQFIEREITYLNLIKEQFGIFIIDKNGNDEVVSIYRAQVEDIPQDHLPLQNSFCPAQPV